MFGINPQELDNHITGHDGEDQPDDVRTDAGLLVEQLAGYRVDESPGGQLDMFELVLLEVAERANQLSEDGWTTFAADQQKILIELGDCFLSVDGERAEARHRRQGTE